METTSDDVPINIDNTMTTIQKSNMKYIITNQNGETIYQGNSMPLMDYGEGHTIYILDEGPEAEGIAMETQSENQKINFLQSSQAEPQGNDNIVIQMPDEQGLKDVSEVGQYLVKVPDANNELHLFQLRKSDTIPSPQVQFAASVPSEKNQHLVSILPKGLPPSAFVQHKIIQAPGQQTATTLLEVENQPTPSKQRRLSYLRTVFSKNPEGSLRLDKAFIDGEEDSETSKPQNTKLRLIPLKHKSPMQIPVKLDQLTSGTQNVQGITYVPQTQNPKHTEKPVVTIIMSPKSPVDNKSSKSSVAAVTSETGEDDQLTSSADVQGTPERSLSTKTTVTTASEVANLSSKAVVSEIMNVTPSVIVDTGSSTTTRSVSSKNASPTRVSVEKTNDLLQDQVIHVEKSSTASNSESNNEESNEGLSSNTNTEDNNPESSAASSSKESSTYTEESIGDSEHTQNTEEQSNTKSTNTSDKEDSDLEAWDESQSTGKDDDENDNLECSKKSKQGKKKGSTKSQSKASKRKKNWFIIPAPPPRPTEKRKNREKYLPKPVAPPPGTFISNTVDEDDQDPDFQIVKVETLDEDIFHDLDKAIAKQFKEDVEQELNKTSDCRLCKTLHNSKVCPLFTRRPKAFITDSTECSNSMVKSLVSLPRELVLMVSKPDHGLSVFTKEDICRGTHFGPVVGEQVAFADIHHKDDMKNIWIIDTDDMLQHEFICVKSENKSNWCRYLRSSLDEEECNLVTYCKENEKKIYFVARQDIGEGEELVVYFHFLEEMYDQLWFSDLLNRKERYCKRCQFTFCDLVAYVKHVKIFHPQGLRSLKAQCKECKMILQSTKELTKHCVAEHEGRGAFVCQDCGKNFAVPSGLRQHRKFFHVIEGEFSCDECGRIFMNKFKLKNHKRMKHSGIEFVCDVCGKQLGTKCALNRHKKMHSGDLAYTCHRCGRRCRDKGNLKTHMLTHSGVKPYECTIEGCFSAFTSKQSLIRHYLSHGFNENTMPPVKRSIPFTLEAYSGDDATKTKNTTRMRSNFAEAQVQTEIIYNLLNSDEEEELYELL